MSAILQRVGCLPALLTVSALGVGSATAQVAEEPLDTALVVADSSDLASVGRAAQALFERRRVRFLPVTIDWVGAHCDELVGRFCSWHSEGEWYPTPERPEIVELRTDLLAKLDELQRHLPGDGWLLGQRVWYRSEGGDWAGALRAARMCGAVERWWCAALQGFAHHGLGESVAAEAAFEEALGSMEPTQAEAWRLPEEAVDSDVRTMLRRAGESSADSLTTILDRLWVLADPLYLVDGNDRKSAHYARWTVSTLRARARNPFRIRWGRDLQELTVRFGWEIGWERSPGRGFASLDHAVGHKHPMRREFMPSGDVLSEPSSAGSDDLRPGRRRPRSLHAPAYAPVLLPVDGQLAAFPRGRETVIVSTHFLPDDTTFHSGHEHDVPWLEPGDQQGMPDVIGLFAVDAVSGRIRERRAVGGSDGALQLTVPSGDYVVSAETWSPERRRAGRVRVGLPARAAPEDIATLSDILLLRPMGRDPEVLESALPAALPRARIVPGQTFAIAWEVAGLGFRPETLSYEVSVERDGVGVVRRLGQFLRLTGRPQPLVLSWEEPGPDRPEHRLRYLDLDLPRLDPGRYRIRLVLRTAGRSDAVTSADFEVVERN